MANTLTTEVMHFSTCGIIALENSVDELIGHVKEIGAGNKGI